LVVHGAHASVSQHLDRDSSFPGFANPNKYVASLQWLQPVLEDAPVFLCGSSLTIHCSAEEVCIGHNVRAHTPPVGERVRPEAGNDTGPYRFVHKLEAHFSS
jgi:hypothetical protein